MGFNGGGGGQLLNHRHDGSIPLDGGPLSFLNITQSGMSAGSIGFSDGAHLQERAIGAASDVLTVAGGVPTWAAAAVPAVSYWELLDQHDVTNAATETDYTKTFTPALDMLSGGDYNQLYIIGKGRTNGSCNLQMKLNGMTEYHTQYTLNSAGVLSGVTDNGATEVDIIPISLINVAQPFQFELNVVQSFAASGGATEELAYWGWGNCGGNRGFSNFRGDTVNTGDADVTSFELKVDASDYSGLQLAIYGVKQ
jgi:hypothetical protein